MYSMFFMGNTQMQTGMHFYAKEQTHVLVHACSVDADKQVYSRGSWTSHGLGDVGFHSVSERNMSRCCSCLKGILTSQRSLQLEQDETSQTKAQSFTHGRPTDTERRADIFFFQIRLKYRVNHVKAKEFVCAPNRSTLCHYSHLLPL